MQSILGMMQQVSLLRQGWTYILANPCEIMVTAIPSVKTVKNEEELTK